MKRMTLNTIKKNNETPVPNAFLDNYMKDANGEFIKVYLYLLRCVNMATSSITVSEIADTLNLTEKDVIRSLKYWDKVKVLNVDFDTDTKEPSSITFLPLEDSINETDHSDSTVKVAKETSLVAEDETAAAKNVRQSYSPAQIKRLKEREDIKQMLYIVEKYIAKPLTGPDVGILLYIYESLGFSSELIEYLVEYCVTNQHTSLRYIEKVALAWHDNNINTVEDAKEFSAIKSKKASIVCKTFGITDRTLTQAELEFVNRWFDEYGFDKELVAEACKRTIFSMNKPNFNYAEGILKKWKTANVHTMEDLKTLDSGFRTKITVSATNKPVNPTKTVNKFNNFSQRSYNFDEMEKTLISNNK